MWPHFRHVTDEQLLSAAQRWPSVMRMWERQMRIEGGNTVPGPVLSFCLFGEGQINDGNFDKAGMFAEMWSDVDGRAGARRDTFRARYFDPLIACIKAAGELLPEWRVRIYVESQMGFVKRELSGFPNVDLVWMAEASIGSTGGFWRLLAATDPTVPRFVACEADDVLSPALALPIRAWEASGGLPVMRYFYREPPALWPIYVPIHAGRWGAVGGVFPRIEWQAAAFLTFQGELNAERSTHQLGFHVPGHYCFDEQFLAQVVYAPACKLGMYNDFTFASAATDAPGDPSTMDLEYQCSAS